MTIRWALLQLRDHKILLGSSILLGVLMILASGGLMSASGYLISRAALRPPILDLMLVIVAVRFFGIARAAVRYAERIVSHDLTFRLLLGLRCGLYERLEPIIPGHRIAFHSGDLLSRLVSDVETMQNLYLRVAAPVIVAGVIGCLSAGTLWLLEPAGGLILSSGLILCGAGLPLAARRLAHRSSRQQITNRAELQRHLVESIGGMEEMLAIGVQRERLAECGRMTHELTRLQRRQGWISALHSSIGNLLTWATVLSVLIVLIPKIQAGEFPGVFLAAVAFGVLASFEAVQPLPAAYQYLEQAGEASRRIYEIVQEPPAVIEPAEPATLPDEPSYAFRNVSFTYPGRLQPAIQDVSFDLPFRQKIALLGPSGAGKSTIVNLLCRFFEPQKGTVMLGDRPLGDYSIQDVRTQVGVVLQRPHIFNTSIRQNLLVARPGATDRVLIGALQDAGMASFVQSLPDGLSTITGSEGLRLSGGQRQRLAIARAFLKQAPVLVLDEAAANLDPETERVLIDRLFQMTADRTLIVITHRPHTLPRMDAVLSFLDGRLVGRT